MALSKQAEKLWERVKSGIFYPAYSDRTPKSMQELIDAGLIEIQGRVEVVRACYVPKGTAPLQYERFPSE